ncbi:MAG: efflux RND transporter permease subunit [Tannerellaceae bacterium]|jgi:multidrug efflux pump subunit AcrB|nr:efflux RND transporter permease subunit [Tannerellaceae bacterium]
MKMKKSIIDWALANRQIVYLLVGALFAAGVYSLMVMPKQEMPEFVIRQGVVIGVYPGANSLEVEQQLTRPLERYLFTFPEINCEKTHSKSQDGMSYIFVELADNVKDKNIVWSKIKHGINLFKQASLPSGVAAVIANDNFGDVASVLITVESDDKTYRELDGYLDILEDRLRVIPSVANARRYGSQKEQITIYVDNDRLNAYGVGSKILMVNLFAQGLSLSGSTVENDRIVAPIHIADSYQTENAIAEQIIYSDPAGNVVRVRDISRVVREYPEAGSYITSNGKRCVMMSIEVQHDANIVAFGREVNRMLETFRSELPASVHIERIVDQPKLVGESVNTFLMELLMAIIAVVLVTMILLPFRVAAVAATSIPISIAITLAIFFACGIPLNMLTLAALIAVMGMIVDNSVVIVDSYIDKLDRGEGRWKASVDSAREYFKSIFSATLAISITFFPFLFTVEGTIYDFLEHFPWAISITLGVSLLVAMLVIPVIQYAFIRKGLIQVKEERRRAGKRVRRSILDYIQAGYERLLSTVFRHPKTTIATAFASVVAGTFIFMSLPQRMMPIAERDQFAVEIYLSQGSPLEATAAVCDSMERILRHDPRVKSVTAFVGESSPRFHIVYAPNMPSKAYGQFIVNTISNRATEELLDEYTDRYAFHFPEAYVRFKQLDFQAVEAPVEVRLIGDDIDRLKQQGEKLTDYLASLDECLRVHTSFGEPLAGVKIELNPVEAGRLGIHKAMVSTGIALGLTGSNVTTLWEGDYAMPVYIRPENAKPVFEDVGNIAVSGMLGASVPLRQVATVSPDWNEGQITHRNGRRTLTVLADVKREARANDVYRKLYDFMDTQFIAQFPADMSFEYGGVPEVERETLVPILKGLAVSLVIIFLILVFHCRRLNRAGLIMSSSLLAIFGAAFGVWVLGVDFSMTAMLGIVGLVGIIVRNGIIMFDYAEQLRVERSISIREASFEAGKRRMRPIFLTSAAASMGVLPMVMSQSLMWSPMGAIILFGTLFSMIFIVTVMPVAYWMIYRNEELRIEN